MTVKAAQSVGTIADLAKVSLGDRLQNVVLSYALYIRKMFWPFDLAVFYPFPKDFPAPFVAAAVLSLAVVTTAAWLWRRRHPFLIVGWLWYVGTLIPVIGLIQVGAQSLADRYTYVPMIGLFIIISWGTPILARSMGFGEIRFFSGKILPIVSVSLLLALSVITWRQVAVWENNLSLFQHALAVTTENQKAHQGLGLAWHVRGRQDLAVQHLQESLRIYNDPVTHNDLGYVYMAMGKYPEAEKHFRAFLSDNRKSAKAHNNLGAALAAQGRYQEAEIELATALQLDPEYAAARQNLAGMRAAMGKQ
jgi:hypothetical protein